MNKRVYGVLGISSIMANWNADFSGYPKTTSDGSTFGSDKAFKYPMKKMWDNEGEKVLYIKSMKISETKKGEVQLIPRTLKERYEYLFEGEDLKKCKDNVLVIKNLFKCIDVKNFGATFAEEGKNLSITGAVQFGQGFNKYEYTTPEEQQILSPFRDSKAAEKKAKEQTKKSTEDVKEDAQNSTLGTKIVSNEAHYFYPFTVNPMAYKEYAVMGLTDGYTEDDYKIFKETSLKAATSYATNSKMGCENEFGLFVETNGDLYLPDLSQYIKFAKGECKNIIEITCGELINDLKERIEAVEIYVNPYTTELKTEIEGAKIFNIFTQKEV